MSQSGAPQQKIYTTALFCGCVNMNTTGYIAQLFHLCTVFWWFYTTNRKSCAPSQKVVQNNEDSNFRLVHNYHRGRKVVHNLSKLLGLVCQVKICQVLNRSDSDELCFLKRIAARDAQASRTDCGVGSCVSIDVVLICRRWNRSCIVRRARRDSVWFVWARAFRMRATRCERKVR